MIHSMLYCVSVSLGEFVRDQSEHYFTLTYFYITTIPHVVMLFYYHFITNTNTILLPKITDSGRLDSLAVYYLIVRMFKFSCTVFCFFIVLIVILGMNLQVLLSYS
jgi:hypothetical protein